MTNKWFWNHFKDVSTDQSKQALDSEKNEILSKILIWYKLITWYSIAETLKGSLC